MTTIRYLAVAAAFLIAGPAFAGPLPDGTAGDGVRIVVPARSIARGETIADSDLLYLSVPAARTGTGAVTSMDQLKGKQARRFLHAGEPVRGDDVRAPILVAKGSTVTMTFVAPGITLTATGKAMSEGGMGETVTVLNPVSYREIAATVTGAGAVSASDISTAIASDPVPPQLAAMH